MARKKENKVFVVSKYETYDGKYSVHYGTNLNNPRNAKKFTKYSTARKFAISKAKKLKVGTIDVSTYSGATSIKVKLPKVTKRKR